MGGFVETMDALENAWKYFFEKALTWIDDGPIRYDTDHNGVIVKIFNVGEILVDDERILRHAIQFAHDDFVIIGECDLWENKDRENRPMWTKVLVDNKATLDEWLLEWAL